MTINNFNPSLWAAELLDNLNNKHVYAQCCNRDYEGDIKEHGDSVRINSLGRVTISAYTKNTNHGAPETLDDAQQVLLIDQQQMYNFQLDDIDVRQQKPKLMSEAMAEAAWGLAEVADDFLAALMAAGVATANQLPAATSVGTGPADDDAYELMVDLDVLLSANNVPRDPSVRWVVVPPWFEGTLRKDNRFVSFGTQANRENLRGTPIGEASGLTVYVSNNVPVTALAFTIIAGYTGATTYAEQINDPEAYRPELRFADAMKGLHLYGAKVTRPSALASVVATQAV